MLNLEQVREGLKETPTSTSEVAGRRSRAGVAIVLAGARTSPSMCFMQRVKRAGDRWSGDVALPGGWAREDEPRLRDAAMRETHEEVGIVLDDTHHVGDVPPLSISRHAREGGIIGASVFYVGPEFPDLTLETREVADAFWVDCAALYDPSNRDTVHWSRSGPPQPRPAVKVNGRVIWGLTYRVLFRFSELVFASGSPLAPDRD